MSKDDLTLRQGRRRLTQGVAALLLAVTLIVFMSSPASAATKKLSGQVMCSGFQKVESIWFLGSKSGWHGQNIAKTQRTSLMTYSFAAIKGETVQVWLKCSGAKERYTKFTVGSGSTRHVCGWSGLQICASTELGGCVLRGVLGTKISLVRCIRHL